MFVRAIAALVLASATLTIAPVAAQQLSPAVIVIVDLDRVVQESAAGKTASIEIQGQITGLQNRANTLRQQLKRDADEIQAGQANKTLTGPVLEKRTREYQEKQGAAQMELQRIEQDIQRARQYVVQQINAAAQPIITQIMREKGAHIALTEGATLQHSAALNITNDVIARINQSLPRVSATLPRTQP